MSMNYLKKMLLVVILVCQVGNEHLTNGKSWNLERLDLGINQLTSLPPEICKLSNLEWLPLSNNQLKRLPNELFDLGSIKILLRENNFSSRYKEKYNLLANNSNCFHKIEIDWE